LATAAAVVVFWPAAFFVGGNGQTAAELAQLKGQLVAIEHPRTSRTAMLDTPSAFRIVPEQREAAADNDVIPLAVALAFVRR